MVNFPFFRRRNQKLPRSLLDQPLDQYDPNTYLPFVFKIGEHEIEPLVLINQLKDHLTLLGAFHALREGAGARYAEVSLVCAKDYQRWAQNMLPATSSGDDGEEHANADSQGEEMVGDDAKEKPPCQSITEDNLPPLGVLMCWHAHMLNPHVFDQEFHGAYTALRRRAFPLSQAATAIREDKLPVSLSAGTGTYTLSTTVWAPEEISEAVQRQASFIDKMAKIGWLQPGKFLKEITFLQRGIVRYHAWLDLMHSTGGKAFLVPTLDIDLAWHTHQLMGTSYKRDTEQVLGMFLNHNDNAGTARVDDGLKRTEKLWKERYGRGYVY